jgi:hypothetical protein
MAIAFVQTAKAQNSLANVTATFGVGATAGNLLVATISGTGTSASWTSVGLTNAVEDAWTGAYVVAIFYKVAAGGETSITFTRGGAGPWTHSVVMAEYSGTATSTPLDVFAEDTTNSGSGTTSRATGTTGTTNQNDEIAIASVGHGNTVTNLTWTNSFTTRDSNAQAGSGVYLAEKILVTTGTQTSTASWTTSRIAGGCIATFKASSVTEDPYPYVDGGYYPTG